MRSIVRLLLLLAATPAVAAPPRSVLTVRYVAPVHAAVTLATDPDARFTCTHAAAGRGRVASRCSARFAPGAAVRLTARWNDGGSSASAGSLPIDGAGWGGACAGSPDDVCRLTLDRDRQVTIRPSE